jgi:uncharacterized membrane protein YbhN (UPF0104 family)
MDMSAFTDGSGMNAIWVNHFVLAITGTLICIGAAAIVMMLKHHMDESEGSHEWAIAYILLVVAVVMIALGFLRVFWR